MIEWTSSLFFLGIHVSKNFYLGLLLAAYPLGQFLGLPILGGLSDLLGRKLILITSLIGTTLGYILSGIAVFYQLPFFLFFSRIFTGFCEANITISQAAVADIGDLMPKSKSFSQINVAVAIGFIIGPFLGGGLTSLFSAYHYTIAYSIPFITASILSISSAIAVFFLFEETNNRISHSNAVLTPQHFIYELKSDFYSAREAIFTFLLFHISLDFFYEFYPLLFVTRWQFTSVKIAIFSAIFTVPYAASQFYFVPFLAKYAYPKIVLKIMGILSSAILASMSFSDHSWGLYLTLPLLGVTFSFCSTNTSIILSDSVSLSAQGKVLGAAQSIRVFNIAIITIIGGIFSVINAELPLLFSAIIILLAACLIKKKEITDVNSYLAE